VLDAEEAAGGEIRLEHGHARGVEALGPALLDGGAPERARAVRWATMRQTGAAE